MLIATRPNLQKSIVGIAQDMVNKAMKYLSKGEEDTAQVARDLAEKLRPGDVLCLEGDLGIGKSVFARALIRHITGNSSLDVPSPTFTLVQTYETPCGPLWHFDLYRIEEAEEIYELGWEDALSEAITVIEWPQRLAGLAPADRLTVSLSSSALEVDQRRISLIPHGTWTERLMIP